MNKKVFLAVSLILILTLSTPGALAQDLDLPQTESADLPEHVPGELLIGFSPWVNSVQAGFKLAEHGLQSKRHIPALNAHLVKLPPGLSVDKAVDRYSHLPGVDYAEPNYILRIAAESPEEIVDQWGLNQIHSVEAWATFSTPVTKEIILATIDTGIDRNQSDLAVNMWENPGESGLDGNGVDKKINNIDDDVNGFVDDWWGWDFVNNDNDPDDDNMHGTAVSSVMAGNQNDQGVTGVCPWCKVMSVKVMGANGSGTLDVVASGITYAADNEAQVINLSLTGSVSSPTLENAVNYAWVQGALVVAAAGNNGLNTTMYPAGYDNAMGVGSTNASDQRSCFSNFAENYISVAAPGEAIIVADINNTETGYGYYSGTSLSAPHVVGLAGLLLSQDPAPDNNLLREKIENTAVDLGQPGFDPVFGHGRIDAYRAVIGNDSETEPQVGLFSTSNTASGYAHAHKLVRDGNGVLHVIWHTQEGPNYQIKYAISSDNGDSWVLKQDVLSTEDEAYHPALAMDDQNLYVAIPSRNTPDAKYEILFSWKPLSEDTWSQPVSIMGGGNYDTVRPDIFVDPSNGRLHLVASSLDNAPYIYYLASGDQGSSWDGQVAEVNPSTGTVGENSNTRYASIHANGKNIYIVSRTVSGYFLVTYYMHTVRSTDGGKNWFDRTKISSFLAITSGEYGISIAGVGDRLYMGYEVGSNLYFRYHNGTDWSNYETLELGDANNINKWPSITQAEDGQAWLLFEVNGESFMRHYDGTTWEDKESVGPGSYANFKLGTNGEQLEWIYTSCNGAPFVVKHNSRILGANNPPIADDQAVSTDEDTPVDITLTGSDPDGDPLTYSVVSGPTDGTLSGSAPALTYTPDPDFNGGDSFTFVTNDGKVDSNIATVTINVNAANDKPVAVDDSYLTDEETTLNVPAPGVLGNDTDVESDPLTAVLDTLPSNGILVLNTNGSFTYTPNASFNGSDTFTYHANDGLVDSNVATVTITVNAANDPPVAMNDTYSTDEDITLNVAAPGVLNNDTDVESDPLMAVLNTLPSNGTLALSANGSFTYTPNANFNGSDTFTYHAKDGTANSNVATVTITVHAANDPPVAINDTYSTDEDTTLNVAAPGVLDNDTDIENDTLTTVLDEGPDNGALTLDANGSFTYTPNANFNGSDTFTYNANDGLVDSNIATVTITVHAANDPPVAMDDSYSTDEDTMLNVAAPGVLDNDTDIENDTLTTVLDESPDNGALTLNANGSFTYTPNANFNGSDTFTYNANDGLVDSNIATVTITVIATNDPPVAMDDSYSTDEDVTLNVAAPGVLNNDTDVESDPLMAVLNTLPSDGTLALSTDGSFTYTPNANFNGSDTFTYHTSDGNADSNIATVSITINPVNDPPIPPQEYIQVVDGEVSVSGTISGSYLDTQANDGFAQTITEVHSGGKPNKRISFMEHIWTVEVHPGEFLTFSANAWASISSDEDTFQFQYSLDDSVYTNMFTIASSSDSVDYQSFTLPNNAIGTVYIRLVDTDRTPGNRTLDTAYIDHLFISSQTAEGYLPADPHDLTAIPVSSSQINLSWTDTTNDALGYQVERSTDGSNWQVIGTVLADGSSFIDTGLEADSTYIYRVRAYNATGYSEYSNTDSATTNQASSMHIGDIDGYAFLGKRDRWNATATVTIHSENHTVFEGATVSATWSTGKVGNCTTNASGECSLTLSNIKSTVEKVTFTVTNLTAPGWEYDSSSNQDPDNDSNGTSIDIDYPPS